MASNSDSSKSSKGRRFRSTARQLVVRWRYRGHTGRLIRRHRALRSLDVQSSSIAHPIVLTAATLIGLVLGRNLITNAWADLLRFWGTSSGIDLAVTMRHVAVIGDFTYEIPSLRLVSRLPVGEELRLSFAVSTVAMLGSYLLFRRFLPLSYLVWALSLIQLAAIALFLLAPTDFPYSIGGHVSASLQVVLGILFFVPLLLMLSYYPLNFSLLKKISLTLLIVFAVIVFAPHLYACHVVILSKFSLLYMPLLYTIFGVLPIIVVVIALYGWGMSWSQRV